MGENRSDYNDIDDFSVVLSRRNMPDDKQEGKDNNAESATKTDLKDGSVRSGNVKKNLKRAVISVCAALAVLAAAFTVYAYTIPTDTIAYGVSMGGIKLGGFTLEEAVERISTANTADVKSIEIFANGASYEIPVNSINAAFDAEKTARKAFDFGKDQGRFKNAVKCLGAAVSGKDILPVITYDEQLMAEKVNEIGAKAVGSVLTEHTVRFDDDGRAFAVPGKAGYNNDPSDAVRKIDSALESGSDETINLTFEKTEPAPLTADSLAEMVSKSAVNASYAFENGKVAVKPEENGRTVDKAVCEHVISQISDGGPEIEIPYTVAPAGVTAKQLGEKLFNAKLASYTTRYNAGQVNRSANIANAAGRINGKILMPGETFSFNETVGKRTIANGFKTAPEYQNGQTVDGIGGGTCQVSTTVYSAALYADLEIVKRSNHSMSVSYVPLGQDATVTDGGIDLKIKNNTSYPVRIDTSVGKGSITVTFVGTAPDVPKTVKIVNTPVSVSSGSAVKTQRIVYDANGNEIKSESMGTSRYKPHGSASDSNSSAKESEKPSASTPKPDSEEVIKPEVGTPSVKPQVSGTSGNSPNTENTTSGKPETQAKPEPEKPQSGTDSSVPVKEE